MAKKKVDESSSEEEVFHVEVITKARVTEDLEWEYYVKWAGYGSDADSWEPEENVKGCDRLLSSFWTHIGHDNDDYAQGYEVAAEQYWIEKEKQFFAKQFKTMKKKERRKKRPASSDSDNSSDSEPMKAKPKKKRLKSKGDSGEDTPVLKTSDKPVEKSAGRIRLTFNKKAPEKPSEPRERSPADSLFGDLGPSSSPKSANVAPPRPLPPPRPTTKVPAKKPFIRSIPQVDPSAGSSLSTKSRLAQTSSLIAIPKVTPNSIKPKLAGLSFSKSKDLPQSSPADNAMDIEILNPVPAAASASTAASTAPRKGSEAENFLNSLGLGTDKMASSAAPASKVDSLKRIPKKWKWTGDLFTDQPDGVATKLCQVSLSEVVDAGTGNHFSVLLSNAASLRIRNLSKTTDLNAMIRACKECQQVVKLESAEISEGKYIINLARSMSKDSKVALIPMDLNGAQVGVAVIFSSLSTDVCNKFKVPNEHRTAPTVLIGYLPYLITSSKLLKNDASTSCDSLLEAAASAEGHNYDMKAFIRQPMTVLGFPMMLRKYLTAQRGKPFTIWTRGPAQGSSQIDVEVRQLQRALRKCQWNYVVPEADARLVFVHLPALSVIGKLPQLADRKGKHPEVHFYTFGSDPAITMDRWGVKPIYTIGGIMMFTPRALVENPFDCLSLMIQCKEHPFWDTCILSWVLGTAARQAPTPSLAFMKPFLELVLDGGVTLLPTDRERAGVDFADLLPSIKDENQVLEDCLHSLSGIFPDSSNVQASDMENELSRSFTWLHVQPALLEYRRFVVIRAEAESHISAGKDGFEWCSPSQFDFGDRYFDRTNLS